MSSTGAGKCAKKNRRLNQVNSLCNKKTEFCNRYIITSPQADLVFSP